MMQSTECSARKAVSARATEDAPPVADEESSDAEQPSTDDASAAFDGRFEGADIPAASVPRPVDRAALEAAKRAVRPVVDMTSNQSKTIGQRVLSGGRSEAETAGRAPRLRGRFMFNQSDAYADALEAAGLTGNDSDDEAAAPAA
jgi:hypothetical protein